MQASADAFSALTLARTPRVGPVTYKGLIARFGSPSAALDALPDLAQRAGGKPPVPPGSSIVEAELKEIEKGGCQLLILGQGDYPSQLAVLPDAPAVLTLRGSAELLKGPAVAMVGARNASTIGRKLATTLAADLGKEGVVISSGLARGIDTAAHQGSLNSGTIAVVAGGIDRIYPKENETLYWEIAERGGILSEMPWGAQPTAHLFPRRNRIVSGLALGVIVVEAAKKSGSLITARLAGEQGRHVFAVPGNPLDPRASGGNHLIREGATLIRGAEDVLEGIGPMIGDVYVPNVPFRGAPTSAEPDDAARQAILDALSTVPVHADEVMRSAQLTGDVFAAAVMELELAGRLERHAGGRLALSAEGMM
ncbi:MAG: DNA-processing protein DprA [Pseudomonadota bacterium]